MTAFKPGDKIIITKTFSDDGMRIEPGMVGKIEKVTGVLFKNYHLLLEGGYSTILIGATHFKKLK